MDLIILVLLAVAVPVAWLIAELTNCSRRARCALGILAILGGFGVAWLVVLANRWSCDMWYGGATRTLLGGVLEKLEAGQADLVKRELRTLLAYPPPGYANRVRFGPFDPLGPCPLFPDKPVSVAAGD